MANKRSPLSLVLTLALAVGLSVSMTACKKKTNEVAAVGTTDGAGSEIYNPDGVYGDAVNNDYASGSMAGAPGSLEDFVANAGDRVFFGLDSSSLNGEARAVLERQAFWLNQYTSVGIVVEGHCDERGTREYNLALGERRATAAKDYLVALGVDPSRITTISYGKERPAVLGSDESSWGQNRRSVTVLTQAGF